MSTYVPPENTRIRKKITRNWRYTAQPGEIGFLRMEVDKAVREVVISSIYQTPTGYYLSSSTTAVSFLEADELVYDQVRVVLVATYEKLPEGKS